MNLYALGFETRPQHVRRPGHLHVEGLMILREYVFVADVA